MKIYNYNRSEIIPFSELPDEDQKEELSNNEEAENESYVIFKHSDGTEQPLSLSNFMRIENSKRWHGSMHISNTGGYLIRINRSGDEALIAQV